MMKPVIVSALGQKQAEVARRGRRRLGVVGRDHPAQRYPAVGVHAIQRGLEMVAADVVEVDVDAVRAVLAQRLAQVLGLVVERRVEAELVDQVGDLLGRARAAHHARPAQPRELAHDAPHGAGGRRHEHRLALLRLADLREAVPGGQAGHAQHPERRGHGCPVGIHRQQAGAVGGVVLAPAVLGLHPVALAQLGAVRRHDLSHRAALEHLADLERRDVGLHVAHPPAHVGVHREVAVSHQHLTRRRLGQWHLGQLEVLRARLPVGPRGQPDLPRGIGH